MTKPDFEVLVEQHSGELFGYLWRLTGDEAEARDCLQDTYLRAFRAYERLQDFSNLRAWLYKIATNTARTQHARNHRRQADPLLEPIASGEKAVELQVLERTQLAAVKQAVMALPDRQRAALMMRKYQELEYAEIAAALDCSEDSARANVYQALKKLREQFAEVYDE
ncbi:MAG: RNA polymerase sigma factor [Chloroflexi bacterium]|nr:RNA polymerase sigma factor [Chloroflexota bacterium]